jgi:hypothetical protein
MGAVNRSVIGFGLLAGCVILLAAAAGMAPAERGNALSGLRPGLAIKLTEAEGRFEIVVLPNAPGPLGHEVTAVGNDYVAVRNITGISETVIPLVSIKCVKTLRQSRWHDAAPGLAPPLIDEVRATVFIAVGTNQYAATHDRIRGRSGLAMHGGWCGRHARRTFDSVSVPGAPPAWRRRSAGWTAAAAVEGGARRGWRHNDALCHPAGHPCRGRLS